ncbi:ST14 transmembrane serine protease matriptase a [Gadus morhua]|uniref:Suppressor of tumorigenicity 14 protein homolog n=1 Tax=Gadus morhua TaxID=8049 RepID=A0A8C4ZHW9_GADMO|nr:suppressor of tumorigenicity 14 protein homolog [Gadus morhua]
MDYMDSGMRYTPKPDKDWDTSVQFLPASDNKQLEKKKVPGRVGAVVGVVVFAAVLALMTGLLVWHFHFRQDRRDRKIYSGIMRITNQVFEDKYENSNSSEFKALAKQVTEQLKTIYLRQPQLSKYYVGSTIRAFSEGIIAYYMSEFNVPMGQVLSVNKAIENMNNLVKKDQRTMKHPGNALVFDEVVSSAMDGRFLKSSFNRHVQFAQHAKDNRIGTIESPGFPNAPYPPNTLVQWELRADLGHVVKLDFDTFNLEAEEADKTCKKDFIKIYDSLVAIESRAMEEICGHYSPSDPLTFLSSHNVMLVTLVTNDEGEYPGIRAHVSQVRKDGPGMKCGGALSAAGGTFTSPNFPNYYPPNTVCVWTITVPSGKWISLTFTQFFLNEPGQGNSKKCNKDYVEVNSKKLCGEKTGHVVETVKNNQATVTFSSDHSYVDRGFNVTYKAINSLDPCPKQLLCENQICINLNLKCDGWNDCGDMTDERNCVCNATQHLACKNRLCKPKFWQCDGVDDCGDNTDELGCGCTAGEFLCQNDNCVLEKKKCDGRNDCGDGSDELDCSRSTSMTCTDATYKCKNNLCISKVNPECDGQDDCEDKSDEANCDCGRSLFKTSRIVGGQDAVAGEFPWQVSLHSKDHGHLCGASIISERWLVTAAHCVQDNGKSRFSQPGTWEAYLGLHVQRQTGKTAERRTLKRIIPHPYYNEYTYDNDIALMELSSSVPYSDHIRPICMPAAQHVFPPGHSVWITGWGATREGGLAATVLQKAQVRIINQTVCNNLMANQITSRMMCAGVLLGGIDACQGDSGGPLSSPSKGGRMFLAGVVSWGDGCARKNKPGIYTRVTKYRGWIKEKTGV